VIPTLAPNVLAFIQAQARAKVAQQVNAASAAAKRAAHSPLPHFTSTNQELAYFIRLYTGKAA
jgi:hypothetical protein